MIPFWKATRPTSNGWTHTRYEEGVGAEQRARERAARWIADDLPGVRLWEKVGGEWVEREVGTRR